MSLQEKPKPKPPTFEQVMGGERKSKPKPPSFDQVMGRENPAAKPTTQPSQPVQEQNGMANFQANQKRLGLPEGTVKPIEKQSLMSGGRPNFEISTPAIGTVQVNAQQAQEFAKTQADLNLLSTRKKQLQFVKVQEKLGEIDTPEQTEFYGTPLNDPVHGLMIKDQARKVEQTFMKDYSKKVSDLQNIYHSQATKEMANWRVKNPTATEDQAKKYWDQLSKAKQGTFEEEANTQVGILAYESQKELKRIQSEYWNTNTALGETEDVLNGKTPSAAYLKLHNITTDKLTGYKAVIAGLLDSQSNGALKMLTQGKVADATSTYMGGGGIGGGVTKFRDLTPQEAAKLAKEVVELQKQIADIPTPLGMHIMGLLSQKGDEGELTGWETTKKIIAAADPTSVAHLSVRSMSAAPESMLYGTIGALTGGVGWFALGSALGGFSSEQSTAFAQAAQASGIDLSDKESVLQLFTDPKKQDEVRKYVNTRAISMGAVNGMFALVSAGLVKKIPNARLGVATGVGVDMGGEAAGETAAMYTSSGKVSVGEVMMEVLGGAGQSITEIGSFAKGVRDQAARTSAQLDNLPVGASSYQSTSEETIARRKKQGGVLVGTYKGEVVEVVRMEKTKDKERGEVTKHQIVRADGTTELVEGVTDQTKLTISEWNGILDAKGKINETREARKAEILTEIGQQIEQDIDNEYDGLTFEVDGQKYIMKAMFNGVPVFILRAEEGGRIYRIASLEEDGSIAIMTTTPSQLNDIKPAESLEKKKNIEKELLAWINKNPRATKEEYNLFKQSLEGTQDGKAGLFYIPEGDNLTPPQIGEQYVDPNLGNITVMGYNPQTGDVTVKVGEGLVDETGKPMNPVVEQLPRATFDAIRTANKEAQAAQVPSVVPAQEEIVEQAATPEAQQAEEKLPFNENGEVDFNQNANENEKAKDDQNANEAAGEKASAKANAQEEGVLADGTIQENTPQEAGDAQAQQQEVAQGDDAGVKESPKDGGADGKGDAAGGKSIKTQPSSINGKMARESKIDTNDSGNGEIGGRSVEEDSPKQELEPKAEAKEKSEASAIEQNANELTPVPQPDNKGVAQVDSKKEEKADKGANDKKGEKEESNQPEATILDGTEEIAKALSRIRQKNNAVYTIAKVYIDDIPKGKWVEAAKRLNKLKVGDKDLLRKMVNVLQPLMQESRKLDKKYLEDNEAVLNIDGLPKSAKITIKEGDDKGTYVINATDSTATKNGKKVPDALAKRLAKKARELNKRYIDQPRKVARPDFTNRPSAERAWRADELRNELYDLIHDEEGNVKSDLDKNAIQEKYNERVAIAKIEYERGTYGNPGSAKGEAVYEGEIDDINTDVQEVDIEKIDPNTLFKKEEYGALSAKQRVEAEGLPILDDQQVDGDDGTIEKLLADGYKEDLKDIGRQNGIRTFIKETGNKVPQESKRDSKIKIHDRITIFNNGEIRHEGYYALGGNWSSAADNRSSKGFVYKYLEEEGDATPEPSEKVDLSNLQDAGEKIGGAKKDLVDTLNSATSEDIRTKPLSKVFPEPDYKKLVEDGTITVEGAISMRFLYKSIPPKPRKKYRVDQWVKTVESAIKTITEIVEKKQDFHGAILKSNSFLAEPYQIYSETLKGLGFPTTVPNLGNYEIKKFIMGGKTVYTVVSGSVIVSKDFETLEQAIESLKKILESNKEKESKSIISFDIYQDRKTKEYFIGKKKNKDVVRLVQGFKTVKEASTYKNENGPQLQEMWDALKIKVEERNATNRTRIGADYRKGRNVTSKELMETFGFRGVEFGNWVEGKARQESVNDAYDALMDMAVALNVSPKAISLNGGLGLAFGARGSGKAMAHYESGKVVINLTKTKGAGSLAHEWWHAMDNYFGKKRGESDGFLTENPQVRMVRTQDGFQDDTRIRKETIDAFKGVMDTIRKSGLKTRSSKLDTMRSKDYWSTAIEMSARSFENYIIEKLAATSQQNDYLANFKETEEWITQGLDTDNYPYPLKEESPAINEAFDQLFNTIEQRETETGVALFQMMEKKAPRQATIQASIQASLDMLPVLQGTDETNATTKLIRPDAKSNKKKVESRVEKLFEDFKNRPEIRIYDSHLDLAVNMPWLTRQAAREQGSVYGFSGVFIPPGADPNFPNGVVVMVASHPKFMVTGAALTRSVANTAFHETYGHYGLRGWMDQVATKKNKAAREKGATTDETSWRTELNNLLDSLVSQMDKKTLDEVAELYSGGTFADIDKTTKEGESKYYEVLEEYLAKRAEQRADDSLVAKLINWIKDQLAKRGWDIFVDEADIRRALINSRRFVQVGREGNYVDIKALKDYNSSMQNDPTTEIQSVFQRINEAEQVFTKRQVLTNQLSTIDWRLSQLNELPEISKSNLVKEEIGALEKERERIQSNIETTLSEDEARAGGDQMAMFQRQTETKQFKDWFGDSKVVDENGKPLVVYHGTKSDFDVFDLSKQGASDNGLVGRALYFTPSKMQSGGFAQDDNYGYKGNPNVMPVYVSLKNPAEVIDASFDGQRLTEIHPNGITKQSAKDFNKKLKSQGFDGVIFKSDGEIVQVAAFSPTQIKSATGNQGTFDPNNPDIRFQIDAFHGSSMLFDRFSTDHIGSGAGKQRFGWGLYFTDEEGVAKVYSNLTSKPILKENAIEPPGSITKEDVNKALKYHSGKDSLITVVDNMGRFTKSLKIDDKGATIRLSDKSAFKNYIEKYAEQQRVVYKTTLHKNKPENYSYLQWDKAVTPTQAAKVKTMMGKGIFAAQAIEQLTGAQLYESLTNHYGTQKEASMKLLEAGIDGITFPNSLMINGSSGTNYVVFDENAVEIEGSDVRFQIIGAKGSSNLKGKEFFEANRKLAEQMEKDPFEGTLTIRLATGLERGKDGKWRDEIGDIEIRSVDDLLDQMLSDNEKTFTFNRVFKFPELEKAYPETKDIKIKFIDDAENINTEAFYRESDKSITLNRAAFKKYLGTKSKDRILSETTNLTGLRRVVTHELAHFIQFREGFDIGSNPEFAELLKGPGTEYTLARSIRQELNRGLYSADEIVQVYKDVLDEVVTPKALELAKKYSLEELDQKAEKFPKYYERARSIYNKISGEVEARNAQTRVGYGEKLRRGTTLQETEDVPRGEQINSIEAFREMETDGFRFQYSTEGIDYNNPADNFYSNTLRAIQGIAMPRATGEQWNKMLLNTGASQAELDWIGFDEFLKDNPKPSKEEVQEFVRMNQVEIHEVQSPVNTSIGTSDFTRYTLPGGENYREVLLTMPKVKRSTTFAEYLKGYKERFPQSDSTDDEIKTWYNRGLVVPEQGRSTSSNEGFASSHWSEPNILAHIRLNEREVNGEKVLFIEEIQSDWAQEGRKKGFNGSEDLTPVEITTNIEGTRKWNVGNAEVWFDQDVPSDMRYVARSGDKISDHKDFNSALDWAKKNHISSSTTPNMPFPQTSQWVNLSLRRMIRYASENNFDRIAWVTGDQSAERYDLSKSIDSIAWHPDTNSLVATKDGQDVITKTVKREDLADNIGKEAAQKLIDSKSRTDDGAYLIADEDLKVGGEGMKSFYNSILPSQAKKVLAKLDKTVKVEPIDLDGTAIYNENNTSVKERANSWLLFDEDNNQVASISKEAVEGEKGKQIHYELIDLANQYSKQKKGSQQLSFPISPAIREIALSEGMPMFQKTPLVGESGATSLSRLERFFAEGVYDDRWYLKKLKKNAIKSEHGQFSEEMDMHSESFLHTGRIRSQSLILKAEYYNPLKKQARRIHRLKKGSYEDVSKYLKAKHIVVDNVEKGGIPIPLAQQLVDEFEAGIDKKEIDLLMDLVSKMNHWELQNRFKYGLLTAEQFSEIAKMYKFYVPLKGWDSIATEDETQFTYLKERKGRNTPDYITFDQWFLQQPADRVNSKTDVEKTKMYMDDMMHNESADPISYMFVQGNSTIIQGEKNLWKQSFLRFAEHNPDSRVYIIKNVWYVQNEDGTWRVQHSDPGIELKKQGKAKQQPPDMENMSLKEKTKFMADAMIGGRDMQMLVMQDGRMVAIEFRNKDLADVFKNQPINGWIYDVMAGFNNYFRAVVTQYNPIFPIFNFVKDATFGVKNVFTLQGSKLGTQVLNDITFKNLYSKDSAYKVLWRGFVRKDFSGQGGMMFKEFLESGALTGYSDLRQVNDVLLDLKNQVENKKKIKRAGIWVLDGIDAWNNVIENVARFAYYRALRQSGKSIKTAAIEAKELTLNFNKKGKKTKEMNILWMFFNVGVQGIVKEFEPLANPDKKVRMRYAAYAASFMAIEVLTSSLSRMIGGDDEEEGKSFYDMLPGYKRNMNWILPDPFYEPKPGDKPDARFISIPKPIGPNFWTSLAGHSERVRLRVESPMEATANVLTGSVMALSPLQVTMPSDNLTPMGATFKTLMPTIGKTPFEILINQNFTGLQVRPEYPFGEEGVPDSQQYFSNVNPTLRDFTKWLNETAGGSVVESSGWLTDINPENLEHLIKGYSGGIGKLITDASGTTQNIAEKGLLEAFSGGNVRNVPVLNRLYTGAGVEYSHKQEEFYQNLELIENTQIMANQYEKLIEEEGQVDQVKNRNEFTRKNKAILGLYEYHKGWKDRAKEMREANQLHKNDAEKLKKVEDDFLDLFNEVNGAMRSIDPNYKKPKKSLFE